MKKTLIAIAALAATSAFAQSSVTMYGLVDVGYGSHTIDAHNFDKPNATTGAKTATAIKETKRTLIGSSGQSTSRLGFRGTEDIGGGLKAGFTFETALAPAGTATGVPSSANGAQTLSAFDNRQAFVSLSSDKAGALSIGRQYSPVHVIQAAYNAGGANNVVGDATYSQIETGATAPTNGTSGLRADALNASAYVLRFSNSAAYVLPTFAPGLTTAVAVAKANTNNSGTDAGVGGSAYLAKYDNGPLSIGASYVKATVKATSGTVNATAIADVTKTDVATGQADQQAVQATDTKVTDTVLGASYEVANAKVFYTYLTHKGEAGSEWSQRKANKVGVSATFGNWVPFAQYGTAKYTWNDQGNESAKNTGTQFGTSYNFSKRTNAYAIYGKNKLATDGGDASEKQYAIGLRHQF